MSIKGRTDLKEDFEIGKRATQEKFEDLIESTFNQIEDSLLQGPIGITGKRGLLGPDGLTSFNGLIGPDGVNFNNGLLGPTGSSHYMGLWLDVDGTIPLSPTAIGSTGQVIISPTAVYICNNTDSWILIGATSIF